MKIEYAIIKIKLSSEEKTELYPVIRLNKNFIMNERHGRGCLFMDYMMTHKGILSFKHNLGYYHDNNQTIYLMFLLKYIDSFNEGCNKKYWMWEIGSITPDLNIYKKRIVKKEFITIDSLFELKVEGLFKRIKNKLKKE